MQQNYSSFGQNILEYDLENMQSPEFKQKIDNQSNFESIDQQQLQKTEYLLEQAIRKIVSLKFILGIQKLHQFDMERQLKKNQMQRLFQKKTNHKPVNIEQKLDDYQSIIEKEIQLSIRENQLNIRESAISQKETQIESKIKDIYNFEQEVMTKKQNLISDAFFKAPSSLSDRLINIKSELQNGIERNPDDAIVYIDQAENQLFEEISKIQALNGFYVQELQEITQQKSVFDELQSKLKILDITEKYNCQQNQIIDQKLQDLLKQKVIFEKESRIIHNYYRIKHLGKVFTHNHNYNDLMNQITLQLKNLNLKSIQDSTIQTFLFQMQQDIQDIQLLQQNEQNFDIQKFQTRISPQDTDEGIQAEQRDLRLRSEELESLKLLLQKETELIKMQKFQMEQDQLQICKKQDEVLAGKIRILEQENKKLSEALLQKQGEHLKYGFFNIQEKEQLLNERKNNLNKQKKNQENSTFYEKSLKVKSKVQECNKNMVPLQENDFIQNQWIQMRSHLQLQQRYPMSELSKYSKEAELKLLDNHREQFYKMKINNLFENIMRGQRKRERLIKVLSFFKFGMNCLRSKQIVKNESIKYSSTNSSVVSQPKKQQKKSSIAPLKQKQKNSNIHEKKIDQKIVLNNFVRLLQNKFDSNIQYSLKTIMYAQIINLKKSFNQELDQIDCIIQEKLQRDQLFRSQLKVQKSENDSKLLLINQILCQNNK